ncbi:MAG: alpha/beta fold hydrolase [Dermatophilaceae bacterium]|jgi:pimeloyl-ACP methyl ester carboxylesterase|nr:alpha/beta fold hydrolase [Actinomycetales bacterium]MBP8881355.1 alpha/beta fold hydrolase [Dermatophilaceae bacterium]MBP9918104.1 alpha/beta fold hydrolase [Dermatophilaceae bacterium]
MAKVAKIRYSTMEDTFLRIKDLKVRIRRRPEAGTPLLLINGLGACLEAWEPLTKRLPGRDIIAVDHPGTGLSSPPNYIFSMYENAEFYMEALDAVGVEKANVLGFSFGGTIAQEIAHSFPERVESLILCGTNAGTGSFPADPFTIMCAANPLRYIVPVVREMMAPFVYRGRVGRNPQLFETELQGWYAHRTTMLGVGAQIGTMMLGWSSMPWLASLDVPTLVLGAEEDPLAPPANSELIASIVPGAECHVYEEAGHLFLFDQPEPAAKHISDFLDRVAAKEA